MPERIQRRRTRGWRMPEGAVYVGRPSRWGNPYAVGEIHDQTWVWDLPSWEEAETIDGETRITPALAAEMYSAWFTVMNNNAISQKYIRDELRGKDLVCWCPLSQPCHADVLLEWANREEGM